VVFYSKSGWLSDLVVGYSGLYVMGEMDVVLGVYFGIVYLVSMHGVL